MVAIITEAGRSRGSFQIGLDSDGNEPACLCPQGLDIITYPPLPKPVQRIPLPRRHRHRDEAISQSRPNPGLKRLRLHDSQVGEQDNNLLW